MDFLPRINRSLKSLLSPVLWGALVPFTAPETPTPQLGVPVCPRRCLGEADQQSLALLQAQRSRGAAQRTFVPLIKNVILSSHRDIYIAPFNKC